MGIKEVGAAALKLLGMDPVAIIDKVVDSADKFIQSPDEKAAFMLSMDTLKKEERMKQMDREMKAAEMLHAERIAELSEKASARTIKGIGEWIQAALAVTFTASFFWFVNFIFTAMQKQTFTIDQSNLIYYVFGVISGILTAIIGFYFGSSIGSRGKDDVIKSLRTETPKE